MHHAGTAVNKREIRFHIEGTSPHVIPMARLAEYLTELALLFGHKKHVHFLRVEQGSLPCVIEVEPKTEEAIYSRVKRAAASKGPRDAIRASSAIRAMLRRDHLSAELKNQDGDIVASYPLDKEPKQDTVGPFWEDGFLDGIVVRLGGIDETLPVHLVYEQRHYICNANREIVRQLGSRIWGSPVRVHGRGKWYRNTHGAWELQFFDIQSFEDLNESNLLDAVTRLRAIPNNALRELKDPLAEMQKIRGDGE